MIAKPKAKPGPKSRQSERLVVLDSTRVLDEGTRKRRIQRQLDVLEQDNVHTDPHANLSWHKAVPKFEDEWVGGGGGRQTKRKLPAAGQRDLPVATPKGKKLRAEMTKSRGRKNFRELNDEFEKSLPASFKAPTYTQVAAEPSRLPRRKFCCVCLNLAPYCCPKCGQYFCSLPCNDTHAETRCMKWTV